MASEGLPGVEIPAKLLYLYYAHLRRPGNYYFSFRPQIGITFAGEGGGIFPASSPALPSPVPNPFKRGV
jgi:hypothetical protein